MTGRERTHLLVQAFVGYWVKKKYSCAIELAILPWGRRKCDIVAMALSGELAIVEVKQSIADFRGDGKWLEYLPFCNKFYFGIPYDIWHKYKDEIKEKIAGTSAGVMVLFESGHASVSIKARRMVMPRGNKRQIITRLAWRGGISPRNSRRVRIYLK